MSFVVDTSVAIAWCIRDEVTRFTQAVLQLLRSTEAVVPLLWRFETANALLVAERRQRLTAAQTMRALERLSDLAITVDEGSLAAAWAATLALARAQGLTVYDAAYLELAARLGLPLATQDTRLRAAAGRLGVPLLLPDLA